MKRAELNFAQKVWLESLWLGARFFAVLPYWFKYYVVENLLFFILYYCLRILRQLFYSKIFIFYVCFIFLHLTSV